MESKFWLDDPKILFTNNNYIKFFPTEKMTHMEMLNTITRFSIYLSILSLLFSKDKAMVYLYIPLILIIICIILSKIIKTEETFMKTNVCKGKNYNDKDKQCINNTKCTNPTKNNPFMNILLTDYVENPTRQEACKHDDQYTKKMVNKYFYNNLFVNVDDLYENRNSQRQFYTMPVTTIPNKQTEFAQWLYKLPETCKTNQEKCLKYEDLRYKRFTNFDVL
jgi:hypothetical protein